ncbi:MAG: hypothetical protein RL367_197, partial [Pseudomonadota bacterium]
MASLFPQATRWLIAGEWRQHPGRIAIAVIAIAVGVALGFAVHLINGSALTAFGQAVNTVNGAADLHIKAASSLGFDENLYPRILGVEGVADASPVIVLKAVDGRGEAFTVLGLDIIRAAGVTPSLIGAPARGLGNGEDLFASNALLVSQAVLTTGHLRVGDRVTITANGWAQPMIIRSLLPGIAAGRRVGMIDIAAAQWLFGRLGRLDRIDLKLAPDAQASAVRARLTPLIPAGAIISDSDDDARQSDALSRAYRVNLTMLALVALFTGTFLVYSTQSLSVTRRLQSFALLRTLGMQRSGIVTMVTAEGALAGIIGAAFGLMLGYGLAAGALSLLGGDLGSGLFGDAPPVLAFAPIAGAGFFALGVAAAIGGSLIPALHGASAAPAVTLKNAGDSVDPRAPLRLQSPLVLLVAGAGTAFLPAIGRLPLFGYLSVGLLLAAGITAMPWLARTLLAPLARSPSGKNAPEESSEKPLPSRGRVGVGRLGQVINRRTCLWRTGPTPTPPLKGTGLRKLLKRWLPTMNGQVPADLAIQHLYGAPGAAATALCGIVASTALMIAMAVMVTSFRGAVDEWLGAILSGDLYVRSEPGWGGFDRDAQTRLTAVAGVKT